MKDDDGAVAGCARWYRRDARRAGRERPSRAGRRLTGGVRACVGVSVRDLKDPGSRWFRLWRIVGFLRRYASTRGFRVYDTFLACVGTASLRRGPRHSASRGAPWIDYFAEASVRVRSRREDARVGQGSVSKAVGSPSVAFGCASRGKETLFQSNPTRSVLCRRRSIAKDRGEGWP